MAMALLSEPPKVPKSVMEPFCHRNARQRFEAFCAAPTTLGGVVKLEGTRSKA
jgi:hypothetical protein